MLFSQKLTVFLVIGVLTILVGIPVGLYKFSRGGTDGIVGAYLLVGVLLALVLVALDRFSLRFVEAGLLSVIELVLLLAGICGYVYSNRITILNLAKNPSPYFAVVWTSEANLAEEIPSRFPFDKIIQVTDRSYVCLDQREFNQLNVILPVSWHGSSHSKGIELNHPHYRSMYIYQPETVALSDAKLDEIKQQVLDELARK